MLIYCFIIYLTFANEFIDPNDSFFNQPITVVLNGQQKHYYDGNVIVHSSSRQENNYYNPESTTDGTPPFVEHLDPYDKDALIDLDDLRVSKIFKNVNANKQLTKDFPIGNVSNYQVKQYIGDGTFAFVQSAIRLSDGLNVVLKQIKPEYLYYSKIEAQILEMLREENNPNIVKLVDLYFNSTSPVLVFQELPNCKTFDYRLYSYYHDLTDIEIKKIFKKLFQALYISHKKGIMHLDIKPANIIISEDDIQLLDWGVSDFYYPLKQYRTRVGTRHYRAPEQLIHYKYYDYSVDIWAMGCIFASAIFKKYPFFQGRNNDDQLFQIVKVLGSQDLFDFCEKYNITIEQNLEYKLNGYKKQSLEIFIDDSNRNLISLSALDLLNKIFVYDHKNRITAEEILKHEYFI